MQGIVTVQSNLTPDEELRRSELRKLLRGGAAAGKHEADADHIFEAAKYGGRYFVTHDKRVLGKKDEIAKIIGSGFEIVTLREFIEVCKKYDLS